MDVEEVLRGNRTYRITMAGYGVGHRTLFIDVDDGEGNVGRITIAFVLYFDLPTSTVVCRLQDKTKKKGYREAGDGGRPRAIELTDDSGHQYEIVYGGYRGFVAKYEEFDDPLWKEGPPLSQL